MSELMPRNLVGTTIERVKSLSAIIRDSMPEVAAKLDNALEGLEAKTKLDAEMTLASIINPLSKRLYDPALAKEFASVRQAQKCLERVRDGVDMLKG